MLDSLFHFLVHLIMFVLNRSLSCYVGCDANLCFYRPALLEMPVRSGLRLLWIAAKAISAIQVWFASSIISASSPTHIFKRHFSTPLLCVSDPPEDYIWKNFYSVIDPSCYYLKYFPLRTYATMILLGASTCTPCADNTYSNVTAATSCTVESFVLQSITLYVSLFSISFCLLLMWYYIFWAYDFSDLLRTSYNTERQHVTSNIPHVFVIFSCLFIHLHSHAWRVSRVILGLQAVFCARWASVAAARVRPLASQPGNMLWMVYASIAPSVTNVLG